MLKQKCLTMFDGAINIWQHLKASDCSAHVFNLFSKRFSRVSAKTQIANGKRNTQIAIEKGTSNVPTLNRYKTGVWC